MIVVRIEIGVKVSELAGSTVADQFVMIVNAVSLIRRTGFEARRPRRIRFM
jgi:hypothetical protein